MNSIETELPTLFLTPWNNHNRSFHVKFLLQQFTGKMIKQSKTFRQIVEQTHVQQNILQGVNINEITLQHIYTYLKLHEDQVCEDNLETIYQPIQSNILQNNVSEKDFNFIQNIEKEDLYDLTKAADYLQIEGLLLLTCTKIATQIKGRTKTEIQERITINDQQ